MIPIGFTIFMPFSSIVVLGQSYLARNIGFASGVTLGLTFSTGGIFVPIIGSFADNHGLPSAMVLLTVIALIAAVASLFLSKPKLPDVKQVEIA